MFGRNEHRKKSSDKRELKSQRYLMLSESNCKWIRFYTTLECIVIEVMLWILLHDIAISTNGQSFLTKGIYVFLRCHHRYSETICLASKDVTTSVRWYNIQIVSFVSERINPQSINLNNIWRRLEFLSIRLRTKGKSEVRIAINRVIVLNEKFLFNAIW